MRHSGYIERIKQAILEVAPDAEVILFGSEARNDTNADSDIDLLILLDGDSLTWKERAAIMDPLFFLELELGIMISPIIHTRKEWYNPPFKTPFYINVMNEGIRL
ncbi:MAG: nucleotidyltransferase domain-containing protein [Tannerellaceae bacterium]|jgi:predicted nucleotidyltransferase|nr:nucleotidyltransferase domain-containing protein [Tannerellaceae bacterium]